MTFIKVDTGLMQALINNLNDRAEAVEDERSSIYITSMNNSDGLEPPVEEAHDLAGNAMTAAGITSMRGAAEALQDVAEELSQRRQEVIGLNSSGITVASPAGVMSYYLPEGTDDTIENVRACNTGVVSTAQHEAEELRQASTQGTSANGRTVDQILTDIDAHRDNPIYAAAFINTLGGAQPYLGLLSDIDRNNTGRPATTESAASTLGHILGAASQPEVNGGRLGADFSNVVTDMHSVEEVAVFNALTTQPDVVYGTDFLVSAADALEELDPAKIIPGDTIYLTSQYSHDPLAGVLYAMGSNPAAALAYLGGGGQVDAHGDWEPDEKTLQRWKRLKSRGWNYDEQDPTSKKPTAAEGFTAALAAASSYRNPNDPSDKNAARADAAATYASGMGVDYFSSNSWSRRQFTETMQKNLSVVMANSPEEVDEAAQGNNNITTTGQGPSLAKWGVDQSDVSTIIYRFGNNSDAMTTLAVGVGKYHHQRTETAMSAPGARLENLKDEYTQLAQTSSYIETLSRKRYDQAAADSSADAADIAAARESTVGTVVSVVTILGGALVTAVTEGATAPLLYNIGTTIIKPYATSTITQYLGSSGAEVVQTRSSDAGAMPNLVQAQAYGEAINRGLIKDPATIQSMKDYDWATINPDDPDAHPIVDIENLTNEQINSILDWKRDVVTNESDLNAFNELYNTVSDGRDDGRKAASPHTD